MKKTFKRWFSLLLTKKSIMLIGIFILSLLLILICMSMNKLNEYENKMKPINTYERVFTKDLITKRYTPFKIENSTYVKKQEKNIDVDNMNPHSKSNLTEDELNTMLIDTGLEQQGKAFKDMEDTYNVNALFAMGVAMHESAYGYKKANTHNYFGFRGNTGWMSFSSEYDCIQYFGKLIHNYYSNRTTIAAIQTKYCPDGSPWTNRVMQHMNQLKENLNA